MTKSTFPALDGKYCNSLNTYSRFLTREVTIGHIPMGAHNPIRIQSMTTTDTMDTMGTVEQSIRMVDAGCEYVRITAPSVKEAKNLANIKKELKARGYDVPLIADIHFTPNAAEEAARIVEKVRINPGNYADKKRFENFEYTSAEYQAELERIYKKFAPLVKVCKEYGTAMRIGTNHGSLSDRIMSHYGDTPRGMVESAMEFMRMCEDLNYYNLVISMKSSNPQVMVQAYRLLVETMVKEGMNYPLHLGVTEAGDGEDGRIKSAVGIGALLEDGLGDTVRVSLTEDPEFEAPVAIALADRYKWRELSVNSYQLSGESNPATNLRLQTSDLRQQATHNPYEYQKRHTSELNTFIGGHQVPRVVIDISRKNLKDPAILSEVGYLYSSLLDKYNMAEQSTDFVYLADELPSFNFPGNLKQLYNYSTWKGLQNKSNCHPYYSLKEYVAAGVRDTSLNLVAISNSDIGSDIFNEIPLDNTLVFVLETQSICGLQDQRQAFFKLVEMGLEMPVIIKRTYHLKSSAQAPEHAEILPEVSDFQLYSATDLGGLMLDGFGDGIWADAPDISAKTILSTSFGILQATRSRISKTEYISCPSCGRTLFDLQITTQMIRSRTDHLKGLKIGIMGCIVNGPGEMADADYGYVGTGPGKITLYRGKEVVKKNVNTENALDELIGIIRDDGNWLEPEHD
ncbi:MAG: 4-hydroxy-3-methylbut-2-en-1-yl diphosphate synthase [Sphingobacteriales bacterium 17-39-43]|uniref:(E)-4-hydroxy-3-methylbut-2-enyl-diphosphate synthase n=1 Tax=Daejeonella sp. TaxID=2805397 RepID=UPI000BDB5E8D|nr:(E)-4-hydroxy-3-methylbut-2-enyl-diphosphate synthase [Daejeonella sp.]OYY03731.1 MAG: 4-hydroxy-3-methylbut-2-en-1-yl diphosphate synthase [Sphingobacteriia bacterium 35-40-5]OYZ29426.1 MAG: 4-hydroxy-3-methylbut-2-en-1-yl diphosphate synthase [Sphingobacteriales bacterium 16-39-50]OZA22517.1 MAG: 4-hydroxy-3-methylbut-2-en-1-yl diphosphate synthase [Sphingobacteriales bacterium 17-39-43]HQT24601.1 (E)-4-hydroxy-3-methylbut-2-enyl-diphosphate synthase [Daejeonella sp.]HQT59204.1 (E)-4-hydr